MTHKERSFDHFIEAYNKLDPDEIAARTKLDFNGKSFSLRIMGKNYDAPYPEFKLEDEEGGEITSGYEKILFLRFLCEGKYTSPSGKQLSYREIPWGDLYYPNFEGRCIKRLAQSFGNNIPVFTKIMENSRGLKAQKLTQGDSGYRFEFLNGLYMSFILWAGDDEFPPSAQILFDDNFPAAFSAEDLAVAAGAAIDHLKTRD